MRIASQYEQAKFYTNFLYHGDMIWAVQGDVKGLAGKNTNN
jgi:hypothetical protein